MSEDYWRERWFDETSSTVTTHDGEQHIGFVRYNNRLLVESYNADTNTCYLREVDTDQIYIKVEQCNYSAAQP